MTTASSDQLIFNNSDSDGNSDSDSEEEDEEVISKLLPNGTDQACGEDDQMVGRKGKRLNKRYVSIAILMFTMLVSSISFSIIFGSVWPYYQQVDEKANAAFLGYIVAACSFGQLLAAPIFGWWSNHRPVMEPVIVSLVISISGSILYAYGEAFDDAKWILLFSRLIIGIGTGNIAIARSYLAAASWEKERHTVMSLLGATQGLGFILGPGFGLLFQPLGNKGVSWHAIRLYFNLYTGPGFFTAILCIINILILVFFFKEFNVHGTKRKRRLIELFSCCRRAIKKNDEGSRMSRMDNDLNDINDVTVSIEPDPTTLLGRYDMVAAWACIVLFFLILLIFAVMETLLTPLGQDEYGWTQSKATLYVNIILTVNSAIAIAAIIGTRILVKWIPERLVFVGGMFIMVIGLVVWLPYTGHPTIGGAQNVSNTSDGFYDYSGDGGQVVIKPGCNPDKQPWCNHQSRVYLFQYLIGLPTITIGFCATSILCYTILSKILGPWPQGLMMGFISVSGSAGRAVGPLVLARIYHEAGPLVTFLVCIGLTALGTTILLIFFRRLVPFSVYVKKKDIKFGQSNDQAST